MLITGKDNIRKKKGNNVAMLKKSPLKWPSKLLWQVPMTIRNVG